MRLIQFKEKTGDRRVAVTADSSTFYRLHGTESVYGLAWDAIINGQSLIEAVDARVSDTTVDLESLIAEGRLLSPLDHPEPARFWITGTGLTHIGSADARDKMHELSHGETDAPMTDSMKIFKMGIEGGKPTDKGIGVQPEWFFKGVGTCVVAPEADLPLPSFALAGGEEAEIVGLYLIGPDGNPWRLGFALGNEFSDQVTEAINYLYLAHSKLRACSIGPELLIGSLPDDVRGDIRIVRDGVPIWSNEFVSGEGNMSHSIHNLEHHHFRYDMFRRPGDLHAYFFGAAVLSCASGLETRSGDRFEIDVPLFGTPLRNTMRASETIKFEVNEL
ncbi:AraD1 family protein [Pseudomonas frederiksbergensis]|uniref:FAH family protein n=1 Tax=Pseudomonas frederiksbergensis TaxID=104087 RepID=A0A423KG71_9PSED|nr:AraD1 family protein [Pseudomonas frederiksbergensis]RON51809.1 FAH family protein [Pseudomonas frederiksbergensis]